MSTRDLMMGAAGSSSSGPQSLYVEDVFSTYVRTGTGASASINNGINLSSYGGLVISKSRTAATDWAWYDTVRGATKDLASNLTTGQTTQATGLTTFNSDGYSIGSLAKINTNGATFVDYTFRKQSKFFDVVTYTGDGTTNLAVPHSLGAAPGMIIVTRIDTGEDWQVYHRSLGYLKRLILSSTSSEQLLPGNLGYSWGDTSEPTNSVFYVGDNTGSPNTNMLGATYIAYIFAHNAGGFGVSGSENIISCGTFTTNASGQATVNLGWEPQMILFKSSNWTDGGGRGSWQIMDNLRGLNTAGSSDAVVFPNTAGGESAWQQINLTATGFETTNEGYIQGSTSFVYMAIRRPMKIPTVGTSVFMPIARTGTGVAGSSTSFGQVTDLVVTKHRTGAANRATTWTDRLRGPTNELYSTLLNAETVVSTDVTGFDSMTGFNFGTGVNKINDSGYTYIDLLFKRALGFFDIVCYTGTGAATTVSHNLGITPELLIIKKRSGASATGWVTYAPGLSITQALFLNTTAAPSTASTAWNSTAPTASVFSLGAYNDSNSAGVTYVAYLFATLAGVSKVGSYTGNGTSQTINCGFSGGARFVMVKCTSTTGDWFMWDTARGIVAGNDPHSSINTNVAEVATDDSVDPTASGFIVNQVAATNVNVNAATYIYLAIA
jgi:hypothetical protein